MTRTTPRGGAPLDTVASAAALAHLRRAWSDRRIEYAAHVLRLPAVPHERRWQGLLVICVAMFISAVDMTAVNIALPAISDDLGAGVGELQWVVDGFLVALAGLLLVGSGLADRFGRRLVFLGGFAAFAAASVLAALSRTTGELIGARALMGAGAACVLPPALALLAVMFPPEERPRALAIWATFAGVGMSLGPVVGGILVPTLGWQSVFLINVPFALVAVPAGHALLPESTREGTPPLDLLGAALSILGLTGIVFAVIEGADVGWTSGPVLVAGAVGLAATACFVRLELARRAPLFDVRVLARPVVMAGAAAILATYIAFLGILFLLPQYLQYVQDESVLASAAVLSPIGIATVIAAPFTATVLGALGAALDDRRRADRDGGSDRLAPGAERYDVAAARDRQHRGPGGCDPAHGGARDRGHHGRRRRGEGRRRRRRQPARPPGRRRARRRDRRQHVRRDLHVPDRRCPRELAGLAARPGRRVDRARTRRRRDRRTRASQAQLLAQVDRSFDVAARAGFAVAIAALLLGAVASAIGLRTRRR